MNRTPGITRQYSRPDGEPIPDDVRGIKQVESERPWATERYLRRLIFERRVPYYKVGRRVLISLAELDALVASGRIEARR